MDKKDKGDVVSCNLRRDEGPVHLWGFKGGEVIAPNEHDEGFFGSFVSSSLQLTKEDVTNTR